MPAGKFDKLKDILGINDKFSQPVQKEKVFTKVKDNIPHVKNYNFMSDILFLPTTKEGFKYCLVVVDLASDQFDIEPIKDKEPKTIVAAMKTMFTRPYITMPYASIRTDGGTEFKGVFAKWLYDSNVFHSVALKDRHSQLANVESLNRQLGKFFTGYMNGVEMKTGEQYNEWTNAVGSVRKELNEVRKRKLPANWVTSTNYSPLDLSKDPKFHEGDVVYRKLDAPHDALGHEQSTKKFREGDMRFDVKQPREIKQVTHYNGKVPHRYILEGIPNASFTDAQLKPADAKDKESKYKVKQIIGKKTIKGKLHYLVWWEKCLKKDATYEPKTNLVDDGFGPEIKEFEKSLKSK